jgi:hypothetical protein
MKGSIRSLGNTALSAVPARRSRVNNYNNDVLVHHTFIRHQTSSLSRRLVSILTSFQKRVKHFL